MTTGKNKHTKIRHCFITGAVNNKTTEVEYSPTEDMIVDAFTKFTVPTARHLRYVGRMLSGTFALPAN